MPHCIFENMIFLIACLLDSFEIAGKQKYTSTRATTSQAGRYNAAFQYFEAKWGSTVSEIGCEVILAE